MLDYIMIPVGLLVFCLLLFGIRKFRVWQWGWVRNVYSLEQKIFIITGANCGLGYEATKELAKRNATVIMACRNLLKANEAIDKIQMKNSKGRLIAMELDLSSFASIRQFSENVRQHCPKFNCLILNAGVSTSRKERTLQNLELNMGVNHIGHFLLTNLLLDNIKANKSRVVVVASSIHRSGKFGFDIAGNITTLNDYYANSKLMNMYFARELYKREFDVHVLCPGFCKTELFRGLDLQWYHIGISVPIMFFVMRSSKQGAQNIIHCATDSANTSAQNPGNGYFVSNMKQIKTDYAFDTEVGTRLWRESLRICKLS